MSSCTIEVSFNLDPHDYDQLSDIIDDLTYMINEHESECDREAE